MSRLNLGRFTDFPDWRFIDFQYTCHVIGGKSLCIWTRMRNGLTASSITAVQYKIMNYTANYFVYGRRPSASG
jgi:hypothetical protein